MATQDTSKTEFRGIAVPHPACVDSTCIWADQSSYDQAGPVPGVPDDQSGSAMVLEATGTQAAGSTVRIKMQRGGFPGGGYEAGTGWPATFIHRGADSGDWYGWNAPTAIWGYEQVASEAASGVESPHVITLANGDALAVGSADSGGNRIIHTRRYDAATNAWQSAVLVQTLQYASTAGPFASLVQLPSGRVLCIYDEEDTFDTSRSSLSVSYSDDNGATWADFSRLCLSGQSVAALDSGSDTLRRLRAAYNPATGEILVLVWTTGGGSFVHNLHQFASKNLGASFEYVGETINGDTTDDQSIGGDIVVHDGVFVVISANPSTNTGKNGGEVFRLASAFTPIPGGGAGEAFATSNFQVDNTSGELKICACVSDNGVIWAYLDNTDATVDNMAAFYSQDGGLTWSESVAGTTTTGYGSWFQPGVVTVQPQKMTCTWQRGRVIMLCNHKSPTTTSDDDSLTALYLGGSSSVTLPARAAALTSFTRRDEPAFQSGWGRNWLPFELPSADGWTKGSAGTNSEAITGGLLVTSTAAGARLFYSVTSLSSAHTDAVHTYAIVESTGTGNIAAPQIIKDDTATRYSVEVAVTSTSISIIDDPNTAATVLDTDTHGGGAVEVITCLLGTSITVWWRDYDSSEIKTWTKMTGTVTDIGTVAAAGALYWNRPNPVGASSANWYHFAYSDAGATGATLDGFANPDDLQGVPLGATAARATYAREGVSIYGIDGPAAAGETWNINTRYSYPIERLFEPSPRVAWRSASTTAGMAIALELDALDSAQAYGSEVYCLYLDAINFRQARVQVGTRTGGGSPSWSDDLEIVNYETFTGTRTGNVVEPTDSGTPSGGVYVQYNELAGGYVDLGSGDVRKIVSNSEGVLEAGSASTPHHRCRIYLEGIDGTEATSGTFAVWFPRVAVILAPSEIAGIRIQINDDASPVAPPEGYFTIGRMFYGPLAYFGRDYSFGRTVTLTPNTELTTNRAGFRRSRVSGPPRRAVQLTFPAVDVTQFSGDSTGPDVIQTHANIVGGGFVVPDEPVRLPGLLEYLRGPHRQIVYLPYIPKFSFALGLTATHNWQRARGAIYGRLTGPVSVTSITGTEEVDEVLAVSISLEEEV